MGRDRDSHNWVESPASMFEAARLRGLEGRRVADPGQAAWEYRGGCVHPGRRREQDSSPQWGAFAGDLLAAVSCPTWWIRRQLDEA